MNKIPTAEEFLNNFRFEAGEVIGNRDFDTMALYAKEFAKLHVEAALKAASSSASFAYNGARGKVNTYVYPLENIK